LSQLSLFGTGDATGPRELSKPTIGGGEVSGTLRRATIEDDEGNEFEGDEVVSSTRGKVDPVIDAMRDDRDPTKVARRCHTVEDPGDYDDRYDDDRDAGEIAAELREGINEWRDESTKAPDRVSDSMWIASSAVSEWEGGGGVELLIARAVDTGALTGVTAHHRTYYEREIMEEDEDGYLEGTGEYDEHESYYVDWLGAAPTRAGRAAGRRLLAEVCSKAASEGYMVHLQPLGAAVPFYRSCGMEMDDHGYMVFDEDGASAFAREVLGSWR